VEDLDNPAQSSNLFSNIKIVLPGKDSKKRIVKEELKKSTAQPGQ
jgi:hypothetical protein